LVAADNLDIYNSQVANKRLYRIILIAVVAIAVMFLNSRPDAPGQATGSADASSTKKADFATETQPIFEQSS